MTRGNAKILVIIVTWNKKNYVIDLLNSLSGISYQADKLDIVVIDNASNDGTVDALKLLFPGIHIIANEDNLGGTGGFNTGLAWAYEQAEQQYDYLWLLDNDVVVHKNALTELVETLEHNPDAAVAGSTMLQLDYPWQINEMGAFVVKDSGTLHLNRHFEHVPGWREKKIEDLLCSDTKLSDLLMHCQATMDVDYVAAASLLIRAPIAKEAGLWMDFFIHFDDVEWCLRIAQMGHRILVSANSLIWHLSAAAKVPSWILYYDNRNILYLLKRYSNTQAINNAIKWTAKKALYYGLLGKTDLAQLHVDAIEDYKLTVTGKKNISLTGVTKTADQLDQVLKDPKVKRILISATINLQATKMQPQVVKALRSRHDLEVVYIILPFHPCPPVQVPGVKTLVLARSKWKRYLQYFKLRTQFDVVFQSDYLAIIPLSWMAKETVFLNDENFCRRDKPSFDQIRKELLPRVLKYLF